MKTTQHKLRRLLLSVLFAALSVSLTASATTILKLNDAKLLNDPTAWNGGSVPGNGDIAQFDTQGTGAYAATNTWLLGANTSWAGIQVLSPTNSLTITNDGSALTLGANGFDLSAGSNNFTFYPGITIAAPQVWNITNTRTLVVYGVVGGTAGTNALDITKSGGGTLNLRSTGIVLRATQTVNVSNGTMNVYAPVSDGGSGYGITKIGAGTLSWRGTNAYSGPVNVNVGTMSVETNANIPATSVLIVNTGGSFTANAGGTVSAQTFVRTNTSGAANVTVNGTLAGNITVDPGTIGGALTNQFPLGAVGGSAACGYVSVNGGGSIASGGYITNNGVVKFTSTSASTPVTFGTFIMNNGLGGIWDANQTAKTFTFPNNSSLAYFRCDSNEVSTLQITGNGTCNIKWLGYQDANGSGAQHYSYTNTFNGGTWNIGYVGQNNSSCHYVGNATLTGGANMVWTNYGVSGVGPGYTHGTWNIINGSLTLYSQLAENSTADNAGLNISVNNSGGGPGSFTITNGGFNMGFAQANTGPENNSLNVGTGGTAYIKGTFQIGAAGASPNPETNAVNLSGGKLVVNGTIQSTAVAGSQDRVFNWTGGQLSAQTITTGAGFNDAASYIGSSTVSNTAGILAPGDTGTPGKTTVTGGYVQTSGGTLAVDIGGTAQANSFTNLGGYYDFVSVSGSASVAGQITANLLGGYTPSVTTAFTVLTGSSGLVASPSTLGYNGLIPVYTNGVLYGGKYMQVLVAGNNLILTNYGVSVAALAAKFTPTNAVGVAPTTPTFTDNSTGVITNRHWDFGDSSTLDTISTSVPHTYSTVGTYTVTLTVYALDGSTSTATGTVKATLTADNALWKGGLSGNVWDLTTANWFTNGFTGSYHDPDFITFDDSGNAASPVNLTLLVQPSSITFSNVTKNYIVSGSGYISGNSGLTLAGDGASSGGNVTLLTTNNYTGATVINFGTLQIGNGTADGGIDSSVAITNNGVLVFNQNGTHNLAASLAGSGPLTKTGNGTLILSGDNSASYSGIVSVNGGALTVASDATLGATGGTVNLTNATLQIGSAGALNRNLNIGGTNVSLNLNGIVVLTNSINGMAAVTVGGAGTLQIDNGGTSASLPTNVVLNGGSLIFARSDNYTQAGNIVASSVTSSIDTSNTDSTNALTLGNGINIFNTIGNSALGVLILNATASSTNYIAGNTGGAFGVNNKTAGADLIINGGNYFVTNAPLFGTIGGGDFYSTLVLNSGSLNSPYYGTAAATDGGAHFLRCNFEMNGGTFHVSAWGLAFCVANPNGATPQTFTLNNGTILVDDSNTTPGATSTNTFYGLNVGNHGFANDPNSYCGSAVAIQNGGQLILAGSTNNNFELGATYLSSNSKGAKTAFYELAGGTLSIVGGKNGGNIHIGGSSDGASSGTLILTNSGKLIASGSISGYPNGASEVQVFSFAGGTLIASNINVTDLSSSAGGATGTLINDAGTLSPGDSGVAGKTSVTGNYTANAGSALFVDLNGASAATAFTNSGAFYDTVAVSGTATLGGNLVVRTNFAAAATNAFTILTAGSVSGTFANLSDGRVTVSGSTNTFAVVVTANSVILTNFSGAAVATPPSPASITAAYDGSTLTLNWPAGQGWRLQAQTNSLATGLGTNWVNVTGATPPVPVSPDSANGNVFYRLVWP